jgi:hypothetical protein
MRCPIHRCIFLLCVLVDEKIFCCHGGLSPDLQSMEQIRYKNLDLNFPFSESVFRIRDMLVRTRIRPALFVSDLQDANKIFFFLKFLPLFLFEVTFTSFCKDEKSQNSRNKVFLYFFCLLMEGSGLGAGAGSAQINYGSGCGSRRPKTYGSRRPK